MKHNAYCSQPPTNFNLLEIRLLLLLGSYLALDTGCALPCWMTGLSIHIERQSPFNPNWNSFVGAHFKMSSMVRWTNPKHWFNWLDDFILIVLLCHSGAVCLTRICPLLPLSPRSQIQRSNLFAALVLISFVFQRYVRRY